jgi:ribosomal protein L32
MGKPKKRTSPRRTGARRSRLVVVLARAVNAHSPVKAFTTRRESAKKVADTAAKPAQKAPKAAAKKTATAKTAVKKAA